MTKERALKEAQEIATKNNIVMVVCNDPISNNPEDEPDGPWGYCPNDARHQAGLRQGDLILFPWADEEVVIRPA
jgi:hypothetical protein